jgi:signal transduction histidine kinase
MEDRSEMSVEWAMAVLRQLSDGVAVLDMEGRLLTINPQAVRMMGLADVESSETGESLEAQAARRLTFDGADSPGGRALRGETVTAAELVIDGSDGDKSVLSVNAVPLVTDGAQWGAAIVMRDAAEQVNLRHRLEDERTDAEQFAIEQAELAEAAAELVGTVDVETQLVNLVRRARFLSRADYAAVATLDPGGSVGTVWRAVDGVLSTGWRATVIPRGRGAASWVIGHDRPLMVTGFPNEEFGAADFPLQASEGMRTCLAVPVRVGGRPYGAIIVGWRSDVEITESTLQRVQTLADLAAAALTQAQLLRSSEQRAAALEELNQELESAQLTLEEEMGARERLVEELREATTVKDRFFAHMSHELRTPVNAVLGYAGLMQEGLGGELPPRAAQMLERIHKAGQHLLELVNDTLDISRLEAGKVEVRPRPFEVVPLVRDTLLTLEPAARAKGLELRFEPAGNYEAYADPQRVRQVLINLLGNAVKFTEEGEVKVSVSDGNGQVKVHVEDTGPGIEEHDRERIFEEFVQVANRPDGTGLGLAISRRLVTMMGGELQVTPRQDAGSRFTMTLPRHTGD